MFDLSKIIKIKPDTSGANHIDFTDLQKLGVEAVFVGGSAAVAYMLSHVGGLDLGEATVWMVPLLTIGLNLAWKWLKDNTPKEPVEKKEE